MQETEILSSLLDISTTNSWGILYPDRDSPFTGTGTLVQVFYPGVTLLGVGEVLVPLALEQLPPGLLGAPRMPHPHPSPAVGAACRPA